MTTKNTASIENLMRETYEKECVKIKADIKLSEAREEFEKLLGKLQMALPTPSMLMARNKFELWKIDSLERK